MPWTAGDAADETFKPFQPLRIFGGKTNSSWPENALTIISPA
jgi:hypothetical protein